jgi:hypothetical protein
LELELDGFAVAWFPAEFNANQAAPKADTPCPLVSPAFWSCAKR